MVDDLDIVMALIIYIDYIMEFLYTLYHYSSFKLKTNTQWLVGIVFNKNMGINLKIAIRKAFFGKSVGLVSM